MVVFINGSFGVGKTTVARLLRGSLAGSAVYDPEPAGVAMMRLSKLLNFKRAAAEDFQDFRLWRRSAVAGVRLFRAFSRGPVIVPMAFSRREYFDEVVAGVRRFDSDVRVFCLRAGLPTVRKRLAGREAGAEGRALGGSRAAPPSAPRRTATHISASPSRPKTGPHAKSAETSSTGYKHPVFSFQFSTWKARRRGARQFY